MATKTYLPTLLAILNKFCIYCARWNATIRRNLPEEALPAYDALLLACDVFLAIMSEHEEEYA